MRRLMAVLLLVSACSAEGQVIAEPTTTTVYEQPRPSNLGLFTPGWDSVSPSWVAMAQTYVGVEVNYLYHRIGQMNGRPCFVYVENSGYPIESILDGSLDAAWQATIDSIPSTCWFAPIAEANGNWTSYHGSVEQVRQAYERIAGMYSGSRMCGSFTIMRGSAAYLDAVRPYVDYACPSHYTWSGASATTMGQQVRNHANGLPFIWAQGGTSVGDKKAWAFEAANAVAPNIFIYFDAGEFANEGGW